jgi:superfamily II DNA or RNA helicase
MNKELRDYQRRWCRKTWEAFTEGVDGRRFTRILSTAATGAGKTVMASALIYATIQKLKGRTLFLADTDDLVGQAAKGIFSATGLIPSIEKASDHAGRKSHNVVGSIQTMMQPARLETWAPDHFKLVIADEAHLSMADGWQRVLKRFNGGGAWILGVTATPERGDDRDLWDFYEHLGDEIGLFELIEGGFLAPISVETVPLKIDCTTVAIQENYGDDGNEMETVLEQYWDQIIEEWKARASGRKTLWFQPGVRASKRFVARLHAHGLTAKHIDGNTPGRATVLEEFERGDFQHLSNAQLLQKGYDCPDIECVVILRPTQSRVAYQQMVGRGTRIAPGKEDMLLLDFLWEFQDRMKPIGPADLATREPRRREALAQAFRDGAGAKIDLGDAFTDFERDQAKKLVTKLRELAMSRRAMKFDAREIAVAFDQPELLDYVPTARWEQQPPTPKQIEMLVKAGVQVSGIQTAGEASKIIEFIINRRTEGHATLKQAAALLANGVDLETARTATFTAASALLDDIRAGIPVTE